MLRRNFFKFLALSPIVVPAAAVANARKDDEPLSGTVTLSLYGKKDEPVKKVSTNTLGGGYLSFEEQSYDPKKRVDIAAGNDGHLWIRTIDNKWKRIVTE